MELRPKRVFLTSLLLGALTSFTFLNFNVMASTVPYPEEKWTVSVPEQQGMQSRMLAEMMQQIIDNDFPIHSVLIVRNGSLVLDSYFWPFSADIKHIYAQRASCLL